MSTVRKLPLTLGPLGPLGPLGYIRLRWLWGCWLGWLDTCSIILRKQYVLSLGCLRNSKWDLCGWMFRSDNRCLRKKFCWVQILYPAFWISIQTAKMEISATWNRLPICDAADFLQHSGQVPMHIATQEGKDIVPAYTFRLVPQETESADSLKRQTRGASILVLNIQPDSTFTRITDLTVSLVSRVPGLNWMYRTPRSLRGARARLSQRIFVPGHFFKSRKKRNLWPKTCC